MDLNTSSSHPSLTSSSIHPRSAHIPFETFFSALTDCSSSFSKLLQAVVSPLVSHHSLPSPHYPIATSRLFPCSSSSSLSRLFWLCSGLFTVIVPRRRRQPYLQVATSNSRACQSQYTSTVSKNMVATRKSCVLGIRQIV